MSLGDVIKFKNGSYDIRGLVDGRYVVRIRNRKTGKEVYKVWAKEERDEFDREQSQVEDREDRNCQIYERRLAGETYKSLALEFGLSLGRTSEICARQARREKAAHK